MDEIIEVSKKEYDELVKDSIILNKLYAGGVDSWEWYGACFEDDEDDEEEEVNEKH